MQEIRKAYREQFYTAGIGCSISGAILFKETLAQNSSQDIPFVDCLTRQAVLPGIKVDQARCSSLRDCMWTAARWILQIQMSKR